ncbi:putative nicotinamide mononucleotide adenylyl transferase protein [Zalerion maritima]|uniref:Nicotinamide-nucleotide adenylyltransferase n=1 Tax=Zalerion maritima TaxID=339359 RepID=A0AAD5RJV4_9PEZI|nr:putative nicotinamide mononucleotide adenylyl transferase protein [Zalerion maritima]
MPSSSDAQSKSPGTPPPPATTTTTTPTTTMTTTAETQAQSQSQTPQPATDVKPTTAEGTITTQYSFPSHRLRRRQHQCDKTPLVLVACGSFSPITYLHLRMFEMASDYVRFSTEYEVVGGYLSPVSDAYKKAGLAPADHRVTMCGLAAEETSEWLMVDPWEATQAQYMPTAKVLDHFEHEINTVIGGVEVADGDGDDDDGPRTRRPVRIALLAGADLIQTMSTPGVWDSNDLDHILGRFGVFIIERAGTDIEEAIDHLRRWESNIYVIEQVVQNDVSSTKIRLFLKRDMSVRYLIPEPVIQYIESNNLYKDDDPGAKAANRNPDKGKGLSGEAFFNRAG